MKRGDLRDKDIRPALRVFLKRKFSRSAMHAEEVCLGDMADNYGAIKKQAVRMDYALINKQRMIGVEIKSDKDTLGRLPAQQRYYSYVCDLCAICTTEYHYFSYHSLCIPEWWGIFIAKREGKKVVIEEFRKCKPNEFGLRPSVLVNILWKAELCEFMERHSKHNRRYWDRVCGVESLRTIVSGYFALEKGPAPLAKFVREKLVERLEYKKHLAGRYE